MSQLFEVYQAEESAGCEYPCDDPVLDLGAAQMLADQAATWAVGRYGLGGNLSVRVEEIVTEATASEILADWDAQIVPAAAKVAHMTLFNGSIEAAVYIYTMVCAEDGYRAGGAKPHLMLHELAHVIVGEWPNWLDGGWAESPDHHGALFTRRHLDLVTRFHPDCAPILADAYREAGVEVADVNVEPASWWNLPRPTADELRRISED